MKKSLLTVAAVALAPASLVAAIYSENFNSGFTNNTELHGVGGWTLNAGNTPTVDIDDPLPEIAQTIDPGSPDGNLWADLGGQRYVPGNRNVELSHALSLAIDDSAVDLDFALFESTAFPTSRDSFGWTIKNSSNVELLRIAFAEYGTAGRRQIGYSIAGGALTLTGDDVFANGGLYHLNISFNTVGADAGFTYNIGVHTRSGTIPGAGTATLGSIAADWDITDVVAANAGDNHMLFDNVVVPEPSGMMLAGLGLGGMLLVRRRK